MSLTILLNPENEDAPLSPGYALLDTAAQHGVCGIRTLLAFCKNPNQYRLKCRILPDQPGIANGIGGSAKFLATVELPCSIAKVPGIITVQVILTDLPLLLPIPFLRELGTVIDMDRKTCYHAKLQEFSTIIELPSGHWAIDILDFPIFESYWMGQPFGKTPKS